MPDMAQPQNGTKRLHDVEERRLALPRAERVVFFAPHTSERLATLPLISDLSDMLRYRGVGCEAHAVEDMGCALLSISSKLAKLNLSKKEAGILDGLFRLKDVFLRLEMVGRILGSDRSSVLLEVHALDRDYSLKDAFGFSDLFYRLPGTRVLYLKDYPLEYFGPIDRWMPALENVVTEGSRSLKAAVDTLSLDIDRMKWEIPGMLRVLRENRHRAAMIEIPAPSEKNSDGTKITTPFERTYGFDISYRHRLNQDEVIAIASLID
jgi:hypothetical protein